MPRFLPAFILILFSIPPLFAGSLVNDRAMTLKSARDIVARRKQLVHHIWGEAGLPTRLPEVRTNVPSPVTHLDHLVRVDDFRIAMAPGLQGQAFHFIPQHPNGELVVVHHGHACSLDDDPGPTDTGFGIQRTIAGLLRNGYGVLGVFMPRMRPDDCTGKHDELFEIKTTGNPMKFFLEPTAVSLNYLKQRSRQGNFPHYKKFHMTGLSGGGWTTTLYSAIDPTIECSFPVAGTIPLYLRYGGSIGDREQSDAAFYSQAGYPELYVLGSHGKNRMQVQILNRKDSCCFGEPQHDANAAGVVYEPAMREYETRVQETLRKCGPGSFRIAIDETAPGHMISHWAVEKVILDGLKRPSK